MPRDKIRSFFGRIIFGVVFSFFGSFLSAQEISSPASLADCLPKIRGLSLTTKIAFNLHKTVSDELSELKATCRDGKLYDGKGREIRFFFNCGPGMKIGSEEWKRIEEERAKEVKELRKKYTVIEVVCPYKPK